MPPTCDTRPSAEGRSVLLIVVSVTLLAVVLTWLVVRQHGERASDEQTAVPPGMETARTEPVLEDPAPWRVPRRGVEVTTRSEETASETIDGTSATGTAEVRVSHSALTGVGEWFLDVEDVPRALLGGAAARRSMRVSGAKTSVILPFDRPQHIRAHAVGLVSETARVILSRASPTRTIELALSPSASVIGQVIDGRGNGAPGRTVWLSAGDHETTVARAFEPTTTTDADGNFQMSDALPGPWDVLIGNRTAPVALRETFLVAATVVVLDPIALPPVHSIAVQVVDEQEQRVRDAHVYGSSDSSRSFDSQTDTSGVAHVTNLSAGRWRVFASSKLMGRGSVSCEVPLVDPGLPVVVIVRW